EDSNAVVRESLRQTSIRDHRDLQLDAAVIGWIATRGPMQFRVTGGDDDQMAFYRVDVVPPPTIQSLRVTIDPPKYTGRPKDILPPGVGHVQGLIGSRVTAFVQSDKVLKSASLRIGERQAVPVVLDSDGRQFTASFVIEEAGASSYWFELI